MQRVPESLTPLWHRTAPALSAHAAVRCDEVLERLFQPVDTIVVGAGVTGLSSALHLAERGARVAVLERSEPGAGSSGRANGQIIAGFQKDPEDILAAFGVDLGERMVAFSGVAPQRLFDLVARHGIDCDAERSGWIQATRHEHQIELLESRVESWAARGAPVRMLDRDEVTRLLGTDAYVAGWLDERNGMIQPMAYTRGLALAATRAGAQVHCGISVQSLTRVDKQWRVETSLGAMRAGSVVLATNAFTSELHGALKATLGRSYLGAHSVQLASQPLTPKQLASVLPQRHSCGDTEHLRLRYFRLDRDGRFVIGGPGWLRSPRSSAALSFRLLEHSARSMFPQLAQTPFEFRWAARDSLTPDLIPHLYEPEPGLFAAIGFNGRGLAIGTALGSVIARRVLGEPAKDMPYPTTPTSNVPFNLPAAATFYRRVALQRWRRHRREG